MTTVATPRLDPEGRERFARRMHRRQQLRRGLVVASVVTIVASLFVVIRPWIRHQRAAVTLSASGLHVDRHPGDDQPIYGTSDVRCNGNHWLARGHDADLRLLSSLLNVESLVMNECPFSEPSLGVLNELPTLRELSLSRTHHYRYQSGVEPLDDRVLAHIQGLTGLRRLALAGNRITDEGLRTLAGLTNLEDLDLEATEVTDASVQTLLGFPRLKSVSVNSTRMTPEGIKKLRAGLPGVEVVSEGAPELDAAVRMSRTGRP